MVNNFLGQFLAFKRKFEVNSCKPGEFVDNMRQLDLIDYSEVCQFQHFYNLNFRAHHDLHDNFHLSLKKNLKFHYLFL